MSLLNQLSSQVGESTQTANRRVVAQCLANPALVPEIADGLKRTEPALLGDCAEVLMQVAEQQPDLVAPYARSLAALLRHKTTRVRWESMHALAVLAAHLPKQIAALPPQLAVHINLIKTQLLFHLKRW